MKTAAIIVAAGRGHRYGDAGKSFALVCGQPMAWWSIQAAASSQSIDEIVLVCGEHSRTAATMLVDRYEGDTPLKIVLGGSRRQDSTRAGIAATSPAVTLVAIHDAARPLVTGTLFDAVIQGARVHGASIAAIPVTDTIKRVDGDRVQETIPRDDLVCVQTPQAFHKDSLLAAFEHAAHTRLSVTDEASLLEAIGEKVHVVPGIPENLKVTFPNDLILVEALLEARAR